MANSVDPDETAHNKPSHLDLQCLQWCMFSSAGLKELKYFKMSSGIRSVNICL